jgi:hypothetical protein
MLRIIPDVGDPLTLITQDGRVRRTARHASPSIPVISLGASISGSEGNSGTVNFIYLVLRTGPTSGTSSASWAVTGTGANPASASDFVGGALPSGTVTFAPGETAKTIIVPISGDGVVEPDETFVVTLSNPVGATIGTPTAAGTIFDDDQAPTLVTTSPTTIAELQPNVAVLTFSEPVTLTSITGTDGALLTVAETGLQTTFTVKRLDGQNVNYEGKASYSYTMNVADVSANNAALSVISNISDVDEVPNSTTFTPQNAADPTTHYQVTYTVAGLAAGVGAPFTISGSGATFAKGAGTLGTAPITAQNGEVITVDVLSDVAGTIRSAVLSGGEPSIIVGTFTVTVLDPSANIDVPTLDVVSVTTYPPQLDIGLPVDYQVGTHKIRLQADDDLAFGSPTFDILLNPNDSQATAATYVATQLAAITSGVTYFRARIEWTVAGTTHFTNWTPIKGHGDGTNPTITSAATESITETFHLTHALTANKAISKWELLSGYDRLQFGITGSTLQWASDGYQLYASPLDVGGDNVYEVTVAATDYFGHRVTQNVAITVLAADLTPDAFTSTDVANAEVSFRYTSGDTVTVSGLTSGLSAPSSLSAGEYRITSGGVVGGWTPAGSFTVQNGDLVDRRITTPNLYSTATDCILTIGTYSDTFRVTTKSDPAKAGLVAPSSQPAIIDNGNTSKTYLYPSVEFQAGGMGVIHVSVLTTGRDVSTVKIKGAGVAGADITATREVYDATASPYAYIYVTPETAPIQGVGVVHYDVEVVLNINSFQVGIETLTLVNCSSATPTSTAIMTPANTTTPATSSALTVSATGVGAAFGFMSGTTPHAATTGESVSEGLYNYGSNARFYGMVSRQLATGPWTPQFSQGFANASIIAATWDN